MQLDVGGKGNGPFHQTFYMFSINLCVNYKHSSTASGEDLSINCNGEDLSIGYKRPQYKL